MNEVTDTLVNFADTAKYSLIRVAQAIHSDPSGFTHGLIQDGIDFGVKLLCAMLIYGAGAIVIRWVKHLLKKIFLKKGTEPTLQSFVTSLASILMWVMLVIITVSTLGINTTSVAALLAAAGMAIGMALSGTAQNFAGGVMILAFKPFKVGDYIVAQGYEGTVDSVNIVNTTIKTNDNKVILLPNGSLSSGTVINANRDSYRRVDINIGLAYGTDFEKAKKAILDIIATEEGVIFDTDVKPLPVVYLTALNDSSIDISCRSWVKTEDYWKTFFSLNEKIYAQLPELGFSFPFPQMDIHIS